MRAWVFDESALRNALADYTHRRVAEGALVADDAAAFIDGMVDSLTGAEARKLRVAELDPPADGRQERAA